MSIVPFERNTLAPIAWKNGGGQTREIVRMPADSSLETFEWRASIAEVSADGPFSTFVGVDRIVVLLTGDGVHLRSSDGRIDHRLGDALVPFAFAGESSIAASVIGGASSDFNVMTRRATTRAEARVVVASETLVECSAGVLFAARGRWDVRSVESDSRSFSLESNSGLWWDGERIAWELTPRTAADALIAVRVHRTMDR